MAWEDYLFGFHQVIVCPKCKKKFKAYISEQKPGFKEIESMICPYCDEVAKTSMEYEFLVEKMED